MSLSVYREWIYICLQSTVIKLQLTSISVSEFGRQFGASRGKLPGFFETEIVMLLQQLPFADLMPFDGFNVRAHLI